MRRREVLTGGAATALATAAAGASLASPAQAPADPDAELVSLAQAVIERWRNLQCTDWTALYGMGGDDVAVETEMDGIHEAHDRLMRMRPQTARGVLAKLEAHEIIYREDPDCRRLTEWLRDARFDVDWRLADHARELPGIVTDLERVAGGPIVS